MDLRTRILQFLPDATLDLEGPNKSGGTYVMDVTWQGRHVVIEYSPRHGFGVSASAELGFGQGPDEVFSDAQQTAERVVELLRTESGTESPRLRQLREYRGVTQTELARQLGIGQAAVSKLERRDDLSLNSLRRFIQGLGGQLEVIAHFPDGVFAVVGETEDRSGKGSQKTI